MNYSIAKSLFQIGELVVEYKYLYGLVNMIWYDYGAYLVYVQCMQVHYVCVYITEVRSHLFEFLKSL